MDFFSLPQLPVFQLRNVYDINTLRPRRSRHHFADDYFKCIFSNENVWISFMISLKFVPNVRINNIPALVQIMAWRRPGDKPLSEPMMVKLLTHICGITQPRWVKQAHSITCAYTSYSYKLSIILSIDSSHKSHNTSDIPQCTIL